MKFSKEDLVKANNKCLYSIIEDFLNTEINQETYTIIYDFLRLNNFKCGEYEGNQYLIKKENIRNVVIIDYVSEEFKNDYSQTRFKINVDELLQLIDNKKI